MTEPAAKERPILFSSPMVLALLADTKTQTRRIVKDSKHVLYWRRGENDPRRWVGCDGLPIGYIYCPFGEPGDRLWVRETWGLSQLFDDADKEEVRRLAAYASHRRYAVGPGPKPSGKLRPSIFMPRKASRLTLEVTGVRVERLHGISEKDAVAEGIPVAALEDGTISKSQPWAIRDYRALWESINGAGSWKANPWVWVVEFRRLP